MVPNTVCLPFDFLSLVHNNECKFILGFEPVFLAHFNLVNIPSLVGIHALCQILSIVILITKLLLFPF